MRNHQACGARRALLVPLAVLALGACSNFLDVDFPGRIPAEQIDDPSLATVLANSVIGDFECAYNNYVAATSIHSDEYESANSNVPGANWGERSITADEDDYVGTLTTPSCEGSFLNLGLHVPMQTARFQAEDIFTRLSGWTDAQVPNRASLLAQVRTYGGYPYLLFGETYCGIAFDGQAPVTPEASLAIAEQRFTEAITLAQAAGRTDMLNLARVGLARTEMDLKKWSQAAAAAALVPPGFNVVATRGTENDRRWNKLFKNATDLGSYVIGCSYRTAATPTPSPDPCTGVPLQTPDPRIKVKDAEKRAFNPFTELWVNTKYTALSDPIRLASYIEAQLILAEAQAQQGQIAEAQQTINTYRAGYGLPALTFTSQADAITKILGERRAELSFEGGHRLNDLLRYDLPWKGANGSPQRFNPFTARPYGTVTCWPLPTKEIAGA